ncbi:DinB family protein [Sphingobacterium daejeonense]|uniref:DinB family protein n=1 Tax=Sphingobacterium daejeonense TaxID=371142 RepID=UPI0010C4179E|nr:DinB family protein [Sphingobacterium daejeonense]VTP96410.1 Putative metal-dependent hydrolase yfiT [Sphingobacterium daejeonense]
MIEEAIQSLEKYIVQFPELLRSMKYSDFEHKSAVDKWSKKEILGHLIDSAINNLTRFIVAQHQENPVIQYDQVEWCKSNHHQIAELNHLISLWESLNRQLLFIWSKLTVKILSRKCNGYTLEYLVHDYVSHFEHHLKQISSEK